MSLTCGQLCEDSVFTPLEEASLGPIVRRLDHTVEVQNINFKSTEHFKRHNVLDVHEAIRLKDGLPSLVRTGMPEEESASP